MYRTFDISIRWAVGCGLVLAMFPPFNGVYANGSEKVLYSFEDGSDGGFPYGTLFGDKEGNLYGTTYGGGNIDCDGHRGYGCGVVFKLAPGGTETVLHAFAGGTDGALPYSGLIADQSGNLYGTTYSGGGSANCDENNCGTVFKVTPDGTETVLYSFCSISECRDGAAPYAGIILDTGGNLYGTALGGQYADGVVFKLAPDGTETVLHNFTGYYDDGANPYAGLIMDGSGNIYGTTTYGGNVYEGCEGSGCGTVFKLAPDGTESVIYNFLGGSDGAMPYSGLVMDDQGNLYGMTSQGGTGNCHFTTGCGTVFKFAPDGTETVLYSFKGFPTDGANPYDGLIMDKAGNFYGTTTTGGPHNGGIAFKLAPDGTETVLYSFCHDKKRCPSGRTPYAGLIADKSGNLYGTTDVGGSGGCRSQEYGNGCGTIIKLKK